MSESARTSPDTFDAAVARVVGLHQTQVYELQSELQKQYQLCEQQRKQIVEKEQLLQRMKESVSQAKSKIKQQRKMIQDLIKRIPGTPPSSLLKYINSESTDQSGDEPSSPCPPPEASVDPNHVNSPLKVSTANKTINRTDISLFSSLSKTLTPVAIFQPNTTTPECQQEEVDLDTTNMVTADTSNTSEVHTESSSSGGSSFASNNSDVILLGEGDVTLFYPGQTPSQAPTHAAPLTIPQLNASLESTPSDIDGCVESVAGSEEEEEEREEEGECAVPCSSKNLLQSSSTCKGLSLRDGTGKVRYKELNTASAHSSIVASNSRTTVCGTVTSCSDGITSVKRSVLSSSPETDNSPVSQGSQTSSAASPSSPSMLRSSGSPWKQPRSPPVSVVPSTQLGSRIPKSDSQLSLDISQTIPLSPELHPSTTKEKKVCFKSDTETKKLNQHDSHLSSLSHGDQFCVTTKPPIPTSSHQPRPKRRKKKLQQLKQVTLTQTMTPPPKENNKHHARVKQPNSTIKDTLPPTVVLATPGIKPVSNIKGRWFDSHQLHVKGGSKVTGLPAKRTHMHQDDECPCEDSEDVLPKKKAHLDSVPQQNDNLTKKTPNTEAFITINDDDVTRIDEEPPSEGSEGDLNEPSPVFNPPNILPKHYQCVTESNNLSLNETSNECEDSVDVKVSAADEIAEGNGAKEVNLAVDWKTHAKMLAAKAGLPTAYKCVTVIKKRSDRDKLDAKPCPECQAWFAGQDGIHRDERQHLMHTCRHKDLYLPPDSDSAQWDISFPNTEICERLMK